MRISVFMIVAVRQLAQLPVETLAASVILPWVAPAIAPPVAERFDQGPQERRICEHAAPFTHRYVMCGIEAHRRKIAEGTNPPTLIQASHRVAAVFNQPQLVAPDKICDSV